MPKYRVMLENKIYYEVVVEAPTQEEAIDLALDMACEDDIVSESYLDISEVEEIK